MERTKRAGTAGVHERTVEFRVGTADSGVGRQNGTRLVVVKVLYRE